MVDSLTSFIVLLVLWSIAAIFGKALNLDRKGIRIYPLVLIVKSERFRKFIENEALKRKNFWQKYAKVSPYFIIVAIFSGVLYFLLNLYYLSRGELVFSGGIPVGSELVPIIPFLTVSGEMMIYLIIASALAIIPHELAHGVVAKLKNIPIKSTGFFILFGAVLGGFVEVPDEVFENVLEKSESSNDSREQIINLKKLAAAGIVANIILFAVFYGIAYNYNMIMSPFFTKNGIKITNVIEDSPASKAGLKIGTIIIKVNDTTIWDMQDFITVVQKSKPGDTLVLYTIDNRTILLTVGQGTEPNKPYIGVYFSTYYRSKVPILPDSFYDYFFYFIYLTALIQFIVILLNALPIFISDGAKFLLLWLYEHVNDKRKADNVYFITNWICLLIILLNFIFPLIR